VSWFAVFCAALAWAPDADRTNPTEHALLLADPSGALSIADVAALKDDRFSPPPSDPINLGYSRDVYWLRLRVENTSANAARAYLQLKQALMDEIDFYSAPDRAPSISGDMRPFALRESAHDYPTFAIDLAPHETRTVHLRLRSEGALLAPLWIYNERGLRDSDTGDDGVHGVLFGILLAMICLNLYLFTLLRDRDYALYVAALLGTAAFAIVQSGIGQRLIWPEAALVGNAIAHLCSLTMTALRLHFTRVYLRLPRDFPRADRVYLGSLVLTLLCLPGVFVLSYATIARLSLAIAFSIGAISLPLAIVSARRGYRPARHFAVGWGLVTGGWVLYGLAIAKVLPSWPIFFVAPFFAGAFEAVTLSLGLVDRMRVLEREKHELEILAETDRLTDVLNRRGFERVAGEELRRTVRAGAPLSLLMIDVDDFKAYNDAYGHLAGDECLRRIAHALSGAMRRQGDVVGRFGGEEFTVLLPEADEQGAEHVASRLRQAIFALALKHERSRAAVVVTISVGVATLRPTRTTQIDELVASADASLYEAKSAGRNRVGAAKQRALVAVAP
jgi:diguanylate cyclase (GGDEF)-like protein